MRYLFWSGYYKSILYLRFILPFDLKIAAAWLASIPMRVALCVVTMGGETKWR